MLLSVCCELCGAVALPSIIFCCQLEADVCFNVHCEATHFLMVDIRENSTGATNNSNDGSVPFEMCQSASVHSTKALEVTHVNSLQPLERHNGVNHTAAHSKHRATNCY